MSDSSEEVVVKKGKKKVEEKLESSESEEPQPKKKKYKAKEPEKKGKETKEVKTAPSKDEKKGKETKEVKETSSKDKKKAKDQSDEERSIDEGTSKEQKHDTSPRDGRLYFQVLEVKGVSKKPKNFYVVAKIDKNDEYKSSNLKKNPTFKDHGRILKICDNPTELQVGLYEKGLVKVIDTHVADAFVEINTLYDGYPHDEWYPLKRKKKEKGEIHLHIMYLPGSEDATGEEFEHPLHYLIKKNRLDLFKKKLDELGSATQQEDSKTPLLLATELGKSKFVKEILEAKKIAAPCSPDTEFDGSGKNALHIAAKDHPKLVPLLLEHKAKVDVADKTEKKYLPIHYAAAADHPNVIELLLKAGANINAPDELGHTPLDVALLQGSTRSVKTLIKHNADIYSKNKKDTMVWEISQGDKTEGAARRAFMDALDAQDPREFMIRQKFKEKTLIKAPKLKKDWRESTQYSLTVKKKTKAKIIIAWNGENAKKIEWIKKIGLFVVKSEEGIHKEPSFQQGGFGISSQTPFGGELSPDEVYSLVPYTKSEEVEGEFYIIIYTQPGSNVQYKELVPWKHKASIDGSWSKKNDTAGGCQNNKDTWDKNKFYEVTLPQDPKCKFCLLLTQVPETKDSSVLVASEYQVVPYNINIGFYIYDKGVSKLIEMTKWQGSKDIFHHMTMDTSKRNHIVVIPTTFNPGEESPFRLIVYCDKEASIQLKS